MMFDDFGRSFERCAMREKLDDTWNLQVRDRMSLFVIPCATKNQDSIFMSRSPSRAFMVFYIVYPTHPLRLGT
jgi:hypothetical protein